MSDKKQSNSASIFGGAGLGLATGLFMGLSVSPTVGVVIGAITSSLALFLGFSSDHSKAKSLSIGAFGLAAALSALLGLYIRSNDLLSPSVSNIYDSYIGIGFSEDEARAFTRFKKLGIIDEDWKMAFAGEMEDSTNITAASVYQGGTSQLFNAEVNPAGCDFLLIEKQTSLSSLEDDFRQLNDLGWNEVLKSVKELISESEQLLTLSLVVNTYCKAYTDRSFCNELRTFNSQTNLISIEQKYAQSNYWEDIKQYLTGFESSLSKKHALIILSRILSNEE